MASVDLKKLRDELLAESLEDVAPAQARADETASRANWGRIIGNLGGALGGYKANNAVYDNMERRADRDVQDALRTATMKQSAMGDARQVAAAESAAAKDAEWDSPESPTTLGYREFYRSSFPGVDVSKLTARQIRDLEPSLNKIAERSIEEQRRAAQREQQLADLKEKRTYDEGRHAQRFEEEKILAGIRAQNAQDAQSGKTVERVGGDLEELAQQKGDLETLAGAAQQPDIPGVGLIDSRIPGVLDSPEATQTKQAVLRVIQRIAKAQSGSAISEQEAERIAKARGILGGTEQQYRIGLKALMDETAQFAKAKEAKYAPEAVQTFKDRGGVTSRDLPAAPPTVSPTAQGGKVRMQAPNGKIYRVAPEDVAESEAQQWRRVP